MFLDISLEQVSILTYLAVFATGILMCFTPCVYPLMPVIIGYLGGSEVKTRKEGFLRAVSYVLGLALVYAGLGAVAALSGTIFGKIQTNFWVSLIVANIFVFMGLCMLDVFQMPQFAFYKNISLKHNSGMMGAFLLGAVSGMVIGPCTTPVLGSILTFVAAKQKVFLGISLLFTYALGMGFPLLVLGTFVGLLKKLPKSGPWMVRIKKVFGLLLIAVGEYLLIHIV